MRQHKARNPPERAVEHGSVKVHRASSRNRLDATKSLWVSTPRPAGDRARALTFSRLARHRRDQPRQETPGKTPSSHDKEAAAPRHRPRRRLFGLESLRRHRSVREGRRSRVPATVALSARPALRQPGHGKRTRALGRAPGTKKFKLCSYLPPGGETCATLVEPARKMTGCLRSTLHAKKLRLRRVGCFRVRSRGEQRARYWSCPEVPSISIQHPYPPCPFVEGNQSTRVFGLFLVPSHP